jgi:uncharacterized alpha-E superfamily protein
MARILDVKYHMILPKLEDVGTPADNAHWLAILLSCSGYEPYHKRARTLPVDPGAAVAEFLLFDELFPRSIHRCLWECETAAGACAGNLVGRNLTEAERAIASLVEWLEQRTIQDMIRVGLHESLTHIVDNIHEIGQAIHRTFFEAEVKPPGMKQFQRQSQ